MQELTTTPTLTGIQHKKVWEGTRRVLTVDIVCELFGEYNSSGCKSS